MDRRIKAFLAIAKEGNVTSAARLVGLEGIVNLTA
jgi:DNA-binding transcriptional LysR family regulator